MVISTFAFTSCGSVNKSDVAILWSGDGEVKVPNSLINCMERAMYIENIAYAHYGANLKADDQLKQAMDEAGLVVAKPMTFIPARLPDSSP